MPLPCLARRSSAVLLAALLLSLISAGAASRAASVQTGSGDPVAIVGESPITLATFDHWMLVAVKSEAKHGRRPVVPSLGTKRWRHFRDDVMQFLISAQWIQGEAELQGVAVTRTELLRSFRKTRDESFPNRRAYRRFLQDSGMTPADVLYRVKLDLLSNRLRAKVIRGLKSEGARERATDRFVEDFRARWLAQTSCAQRYRTQDCSQTLPAPA